MRRPATTPCGRRFSTKPTPRVALAGWERRGVPIVNSPRAARNTYRDRLPALMAAAGVPFPETALITTRDPRAPDMGSGFWLKRGDVHASVSADVQWVDSRAAFE